MTNITDKLLMVVRLFRVLILFSLVYSSLLFAAQGPQSFTLDGILKQAGTNNPLLDPNVTITVQIMDPTKQCLLYEEQQTVNTTASKGYFNIVVGSDLGSPKRTGNDPGLATYQIYQNSGAVIASNVPGQTCAGGLFTPVTQDYRYMRIIVTPSSTGVADTLSPDTLMDAVPAAVVAEWAESVGGFTPNDLLKVNVGAGYNLSQVNLESLFTNAAWPNLQAVAAGNFMNKTANNGASLPTYTTGAPPIAPAEGSIWFDSDTNQIKYYDGAATQIVGTSGMGVTSVDTTTNFTVDGVAGGTITSTGEIDLSNTGVVAGTYPKVQVDAKGRVLAGTATLLETDLPAVIDDPGRVSGDAITSGTIGGSTSIATTGTVSAASASFRQIDLYDSDNSNYVRFLTPATGVLTSNYTLTFPANAGTSGQALTTDGSGGLAWTTIVSDVGNTADLSNGMVWIGDGAGTAQERAISGDIAITNTGVATIQADTVTYAKIQNVTDNRLLGRSAGSAGDVQEIQVGTGLTMAAGTIALTDTTDDDTLGGLSCANNEVPRWNGAAWVCRTAYENGGNSFGADATIGLNDNFRLDIETNNVPRITIAASGNVGIGTTDMNAALKVSRNTTVAAPATDNADAETLLHLVASDNKMNFLHMDSFSNSSWRYPVFDFRRAEGTAAAPLNITDGTSLGSIRGSGWVDSAYVDGASILFTGEKDWSTTERGTSVRFSVAPINSASTQRALTLGIDHASRGSLVGIGSASNRSQDSWTTTGSLLNVSYGTVTDLTGVGTLASPRVSTSFGIPTFASSNALTVTNAANVYIAGPPSAGANTTITNSHALYVESGSSYFGGNVGVGTVAPDTKLSVAGTIRVGDGGETCSGGNFTGGIRYNGGNLQFCDGAAWNTLGLAGSGITSLTGDVTATGPGAAAATISNDAVTFAKMQNINTQRLLGRGTAAVGDVEEISLGAGLTLTGTTLDVTDGTDNDVLGALSCAANEVPIWNGGAWVCQLAAAANGNGTLVLRDGSGNFASNNITANGFSVNNAGSLVNISSPVGANYGLILPAAVGSANQVLTAVDGSGTLGWSTALTSSTGYINGGNSFGADATIGLNDNFRLDVKTNNSVRMTVAAGGNVGIGVTDPSERLQVSSSFSVSNAGGSKASIWPHWMTIDAVGSSGVGVSFADDTQQWNILKETDDSFRIRDVTGSATRVTVTTAGDFIVGSSQKSDTGTGTEDNRLFFDKAKGAFRAGRASSTQWDDANVGNYSIALGNGTTAAGTNSIAIGAFVNADTTTVGNMAFGYDTTVSGDRSIAFGLGNEVGGNLPEVTGADSLGFFLGDNSDSVVSGTRSMGIFMNRTGVDLAADDVVAIMGGRLGVGTVAPGRALHVAGPIRLDPAALPGTPAVGDVVIDSGDSNKLKWYDGTVWQTVGTGSATGDFMKDGSVAMTGTFKAVDGTAAAPAMTFAADQDTGIYRPGADALALAAGGTDRLNIESSGEVGIGTASPNTKLDVRGAIRATDPGSSSHYAELNTAGIGNVTLKMNRVNTSKTMETQLLEGGSLKWAYGNSDTGAGSGTEFFIGQATGGTNANFWIETNGNVGIGSTDPQSRLDVNGAISIRGVNGIRYPTSETTTGATIAIGPGALANLSSTSAGYGDLAIGYNSLAALTTGTNNIAIGVNALAAGPSTGTNNVVIGNSAGVYMYTGASRNVAIGDSAMYGNSMNAVNNVAVGHAAIGNGTIGGSNNTSVGAYTGFGLGRTAAGEAENNTFLGSRAGNDVSTGSRNIIIGSYPTDAVGITTGSNNIMIGYDLRPTAQTVSNHLNIGNLVYATGLGSGTTASTGNVGIGVTDPGVKLEVAGTVRVGDGGETCASGNFTGGIRYNGGNLQFCNGTAWQTLGTASGAGDFMKDGSVAMTGVLRVTDGTAAAPAIAFANETGTGIYRSAANRINFAVNGSQSLQILGSSDAYISSGIARFSSGAVGSPAFGFQNDVDTGMWNPSDNIIAFSTGGTEKMRMNGTGYVGIGTTNPTEVLEVNGRVRTTEIRFATAANNYITASGNYLHFGPNGINTFQMSSSTIDANAPIRVGNGITQTNPAYAFSGDNNTGMFNPAADTIAFATDGAERVRIVSTTGHVGIGTTAPTQKLHVNGNVLADAYLHTSDRRLKEEFEPLDDSLQKLLGLSTLKFNWKAPVTEEQHRRQIGLIAQEVQQVYPEAVVEDENGWLRLNYLSLVAPIIDSLRELYNKVTASEQRAQVLESRVKELEEKNKQLEERLLRLEQNSQRQPAGE